MSFFLRSVTNCFMFLPQFSFLSWFIRIRHRQIEMQNSGNESLDHPGNGGLADYKELAPTLWRGRYSIFINSDY